MRLHHRAVSQPWGEHQLPHLHGISLQVNLRGLDSHEISRPVIVLS